MREIHRNSNWAYQVAYMFTPRRAEPKQTDGCTIFWRWLLCIIPYCILATFCWIVFGLLFGIIAQIVYRFVLFLIVARTLEFDGYQNRYTFRGKLANLFEWLPAKSYLDRLNVFQYEANTIRWLEWLPEFDPDTKMGPFVLLFLATVCLSLFAGTAYLFWWLVSLGYLHFMERLEYLRATLPVWGVALGSIIFLILVFTGGRMGWQNFSATESGKLFKQRWYDFKHKHCTMYVVVE